MSALSLRLPELLHKQVKELAEKEGISINQFVTSVVAEKMSVLVTEEYLGKRAARGKNEVFEAVLKKIPSVKPDEQDRV
jgi:HicB family